MNLGAQSAGGWADPVAPLDVLEKRNTACACRGLNPGKSSPYYVCIAVFTLDVGLLARSQYSEGPETGHIDTGFSWFPCVYK